MMPKPVACVSEMEPPGIDVKVAFPSILFELLSNTEWCVTGGNALLVPYRGSPMIIIDGFANRQRCIGYDARYTH